jgi:hypothetical protein
MKQLIGGITGALITGVAILGWNGPAASGEAFLADAQARGPVQLVSDGELTPAAVMDREAALTAMNVTCEPGQRAVVRRVPAVAASTMDVACVSQDDDLVGLPAQQRFATLSPASRVRAVPVDYSAPRVASRQAPRGYDRAPVREIEPRRSWKKRALVIGGSAGAGAGIGALAGGKKGALIGAAIGGGAGTLYEVVKH